jgi:hypothetical protein
MNLEQLQKKLVAAARAGGLHPGDPGRRRR